MKKTICILLLSAAAVVASAQTTPAPTAQTTPKAKTKAKPAPAASAPLKIPSDAVKTEDGSYRWTDPHGKVWLYRDTPFGVSRMAGQSGTNVPAGYMATPFGVTKKATTNEPVAPVPPGDPNEHVTAVAHGGMIRFEKPNPFGATAWEKKATDLTPDEQKIWDREQAKRKQ
jgi:hypothetical protein